MATVKISQLPALTGANTAATDVIPIVDVSGNITNKITREEFFKNIQGNVGIGTSSPDGNLTVGSTTTSGDISVRIKGDATSRGFLMFGDAGGAQLGDIMYDHSTDHMRFRVNNSERMRIDSSGNVGVGTTSPNLSSSPRALTVGGSSECSFEVQGSRVGTDGNVGGLRYYNGSDQLAAILARRTGADNSGSILAYTASAGVLSERMRIDSSGNVGIGVTPSAWRNAAGADLALQVRGAALVGVGNYAAELTLNAYLDSAATWRYIASGEQAFRYSFMNDGSFAWFNAPSGTAGNAITFTQAMTLDASGNLLVGTTSYDTNVVGHALGSNGYAYHTSSSNVCLDLNRKTTDGSILQFKKDGTTVGSIGSLAGTQLYIESSGNQSGLRFEAAGVTPRKNGASSDNTVDMGSAVYRFNDIYATNNVIQTSDRNEKQDIEELSEAERRVAVACKGLLRKYRWKDSVAEKGDAARIHFGIIAQDLQAAFEAEGLDAGRYAMFIHSTWTDEETGEERSRMGVRYPELLAFIIAAL